MTRVLITDYAWNDLSIEAEAFGNAGYELTSGPAIAAPVEEIERLVALHRPAAILTCWARVSAKAIEANADLKVVCRLGVGLDNIDVAACTRRGVWVTNVPDYCIEEVSDHAVGLVLAWSRGLVILDRAAKQGSWCSTGAQLRRLSELTIGIVGYGPIARKTIQKLQGWNARLLISNRSRVGDPALQQVELRELLQQSDVIVLHVALNSDTHHLMNEHTLSSVKPGAFLVNVSRGGLVDNSALLRALDSGRLGGAGLDVIDGEPAPPPELMRRENVLITPHVAFSSEGAIRELRQRAVKCALAALSGITPPPHACNDPTAAIPPLQEVRAE